MDFIHSVLATNQAVAADGDQTFDLPVNPLSAVLIHLNPLNETAALASYRFLDGLLSALDNVRVNHLGASVVDLRGQDLAAMAMLYHQIGIWQSNARNTDNERRSLVIPVLFGRRAYDPKECFPATRRGELQLTCTWDIADTGFDNLRISVETIELLGATPEFVEKKTATVQTFPATGVQEVDLPIGNVLRGILLFGTTGYTGAVPAPTIAEVELLISNVQRMYSHTDWEVLRSVSGLRGAKFMETVDHFHEVNAAGAGSEDTRGQEIIAGLMEQYGLLDLDPLRDDTFAVDTAGASRVHLRVTAETANAMRAMSIERVPASFYSERSRG
jgi:hypothetical protein